MSDFVTTLSSLGDRVVTYESVGIVRYLMQEAAALLFQDGFDPADIPKILADLQAAADEAHTETGGN